MILQSSSAPTLASKPVFVPDTSRSAEPLPDGLIAWDSLLKSTNVLSGLDFARFSFAFTNISSKDVTILNVHPSCGCTTAELPPVPWTLPAGTNGEIKIKVNLANKSGTVFKSVKVTTDQGNKTLMLRINILTPAPVKLTASQIEQGIQMSKADRQAVFKGDCASCHDNHLQGRYGQDLFNSACAICHATQNQATMVPNLSKLTVPTNPEFWRTWISLGKPGSLMPAFATSQGGPLTDMQIASLASYLNAVYPSKAPSIQ
jgi:mono/diheme cytochrome c family protein